MWAVRTPKIEPPQVTGSSLERTITRQINSCDDTVALSNVYIEWGASFNYIHASAAVVQYGRIVRKGSDKQLFGRLMNTWLQQLPLADT